jgi:hypothetical protein
MSDQMWFQRVINARDGFDGFWLCPTPNCSGAGFTVDIFPTDPNHPANEGWSSDDGDEEDWDDTNESDGSSEFDPELAAADPQEEWDPAEPTYARAFEDDDTEGEEWKLGVSPADAAMQPPVESPGIQAARRAWEEEQKRYDMPDERPRVVDWSNRPEPPPMNMDDIPF